VFTALSFMATGALPVTRRMRILPVNQPIIFEMN
jgi:hypothetical protein